jgi:hypothetical protein
MADAKNAVFLSYASEDAEAALGICEALRAAGIEVVFDQSELRGGDAWDHKIRTQIRETTMRPLRPIRPRSQRTQYIRPRPTACAAFLFIWPAILPRPNPPARSIPTITGVRSAWRWCIKASAAKLTPRRNLPS